MKKFIEILTKIISFTSVIVIALDAIKSVRDGVQKLHPIDVSSVVESEVVNVVEDLGYDK